MVALIGGHGRLPAVETDVAKTDQPPTQGTPGGDAHPLEKVARFLSDLHPGLPVEWVEVKLVGIATPIHVQVAQGNPAGPEPSDADDEAGAVRYTPGQVPIVALFTQLESDARVKGVRIAALMKKEYGSIRRHLSALVRMDVLQRDEADDGYSRGPTFQPLE